MAKQLSNISCFCLMMLFFGKVFMKNFVPLMILFLALVVVFFSLYGDDSFSNLNSLKENYRMQRTKNARVSDYVRELKKKVVGIQNDDRVLEKVARNELGLARPDELIIIFNQQSGEAD